MGGETLDYEKIKKLAEACAHSNWDVFLESNQLPLLDECLQVRRAWMFFRNPDIKIPEESFLYRFAIVVSDRGEVRTTADFFPDMNECRKYLSTMSDYFDEKNL